MGAHRYVCFGLLAACGGGGGFPDAKELDASPTGMFSATWSVVDQDSQPLPCERIAGQTMTVLAHNKAFDGGSTQIFTCSTGMGTSQAIVAGDYNFDFELGGAVGLLAKATSQPNVSIPAGTTTPLAPLTFQVQATGGIELKLDSQKSGGNCGAATAGAGIAAVVITLNSTSNGGACLPATLTISDGASQPGGTYTIDCGTPQSFGCIETDQTITASGLPSDGYTIHVKGLNSSATPCWLNDDMIQVPPLDKTLQRTLNLTQQTQTTGC